MVNLQQVFDTVLHNGLTTYKTKNSKYSIKTQASRDKKGVIFAVRDKSNFTMNGVKGYVITSKETILEDCNSLTHWTPNVFCNGTYADQSRKYIKGFDERNLSQVNCFVVDIDTKDHSPGQIILECVDNGLSEPTLIVESDKGYHVYFVLDKPLFINNKDDYKGLKVAKRISENIKSALKNVSADIGCNDFVFFRIPNQNNIVWFNSDNRPTINQFINWSKRYDDDNSRKFKVLQGGLSKQSKTEWIIELVKNGNIKGSKGQLGRNNIIFTLALSCMQDGKSEDECFDVIDIFNSHLVYAIKEKEIHNIIRSAYSGKYSGASEKYIKEFYELYVGKKYESKITPQHWYKFAKTRENRERSHYEEWEMDIQKFIQKSILKGNQFIWLSQNELCSEIGISRSTLNEVFKRSKRLIKTVNGKGRFAKTGFTTISVLFDYAIHQSKQSKLEYRKYIKSFITELECELEINESFKILTNLLKRTMTNDFEHKESLII